MDVYLIPLASDRYELYCEPGDEREEGQHDLQSGLIARLLERFRVTLSRLDRHQAAVHAEQDHRERRRRASDRAARWLAEKVAEQRLLWRLRRHAAARTLYPKELSESQVKTIVQRLLQRDADRHRLWMIVDSVGFVLSGVFFLVPGPNLVAYYFLFRLVGHYLSMRGARHGLNGVVWTYEPCEPLAALRQVFHLPVSERHRYVREIAAQLKLAHLPRFFRRAADYSA